jgi:hypothetical protein
MGWLRAARLPLPPALSATGELIDRQRVGTDMNMIYNSPHFCVVEFSDYGAGARHASGGFEIMDKSLRREIFLGGEEAERFRASVAALIESEPSLDDVDEFLHSYTGLMTQPLTLH